MDPTPPEPAPVPTWRQALKLAFLVALAGYFLVVFQMSLTYVPTWAVPGLWQMFTLRDPTASMVVAEARYGDQKGWQPVDLGALFPSRWGSGYRFSRSSFKKNKGRMMVLGASTCLRLDPEPLQVRFIEHRWEKVLGSTEHRNPTQRTLHVHRCDREVRLPNGTMLPDAGRRE